MNATYKEFALVEPKQADAKRGSADEVAVDAPIDREQAHVAALHRLTQTPIRIWAWAPWDALVAKTSHPDLFKRMTAAGGWLLLPRCVVFPTSNTGLQPVAALRAKPAHLDRGPAFLPRFAGVQGLLLGYPARRACRLAGAWGAPLRSSPSADSWNGGSLVSTCGPSWYPCAAAGCLK